MPMTESEILERDAGRDIGAELLESIREMKGGQIGAIHSPVAIARYRVHMSADRFAALLGVPLDALRAWEQGDGEPDGAAQALIRIALERPEVVRDLFLGRAA